MHWRLVGSSRRAALLLNQIRKTRNILEKYNGKERVKKVN